MCASGNSFSSDTLVATDKGLLAIATLTAGSMALAYNEATGENEYKPILEIISHGESDQQVTFLTLQDTESSQLEMIVTTPGHPFYLEVNSDASSRPAPQGHEDLAEPWVGAGDLKVGDKVRQADGTTGTVRIVKTEQKNQTMYNLDVANLDNFYVGEQGWLVHNTNPCGVLALGFHGDNTGMFLRNFANATGGGDLVADLNKHLYPNATWIQVFEAYVTSPSTKSIKFNLDLPIGGLINVDDAIRLGKEVAEGRASFHYNSTNYELYFLHQNKDLWNKITWYSDNTTTGTPAAFK